MDLRSIFERNLRNAGRHWLTAGLCLLTLAIGFGGYTGLFLMKSITATGTIIGASPSDSNANGSLDTPTFTFTAEDGKPYTVTSVVSTSPPEFAVGQEVKVFYEKSHPEGARLDSFWQLWFFSFLFGILGTFFTTVGYFLMQYQRRRVRQRLMNSTSGGVLSGTEL